ncbi:hypothetical protein MY3296_006540 [Beauveria thailandica]
MKERLLAPGFWDQDSQALGANFGGSARRLVSPILHAGVTLQVPGMPQVARLRQGRDAVMSDNVGAKARRTFSVEQTSLFAIALLTSHK